MQALRKFLTRSNVTPLVNVSLPGKFSQHLKVTPEYTPHQLDFLTKLSHDYAMELGAPEPMGVGQMEYAMHEMETVGAYQGGRKAATELAPLVRPHVEKMVGVVAGSGNDLAKARKMAETTVLSPPGFSAKAIKQRQQLTGKLWAELGAPEPVEFGPTMVALGHMDKEAEANARPDPHTLVASTTSGTWGDNLSRLSMGIPGNTGTSNAAFLSGFGAGMQDVLGKPSTVIGFSQGATALRDAQDGFGKMEMDEQSKLRHVTFGGAAKLRTEHTAYRGLDPVPLVAWASEFMRTTTSGSFDVVGTSHGHNGLAYAKSFATTERLQDQEKSL